MKKFWISLLVLGFCMGCTGSVDNQRTVMDTTRVQMTDTTTNARPLPQWLIDHKERTRARETKPDDVIREDDSMVISLSITGIILVLMVIVASIVILKRKPS